MRRRFVAFIGWRRLSSAWAYGCIASSWLGLTFVLGSILGYHGPALWIGSVALYLLTVEVGWAYLVAVAWSSHRVLEVEGERLAKARPRPASPD